MTDSGRERKSFRPRYNRRMRRFSKEMLITADYILKHLSKHTFIIGLFVTAECCVDICYNVCA